VTQAPDTPLLSFVLLNWNTAALSQNLIASLASQTSRAFELIVVDNGSHEPFDPRTPPWLQTQVLRLDQNYGFAGGMNRGIDVARGNLICPSNSDVVFAPDFVERAHQLQRDLSQATGIGRVGAFGGLVLAGSQAINPLVDAQDGLEKGMIDGAGSVLSWQGRLVQVPSRSLATQQTVFGVTGACPILTADFCRAIAVDTMVFDERYHSYAEDIDLFMRARTHGWSVVYTPTLRALHWRSMSSGGKRRIFDKPTSLQRQIFRNMTWNILKNLTALEVALYTPVFLLNAALVTGWAFIPGTGLSVAAAFGGHFVDPFLNLSWVRGRRAKVQVRPWYDCRILGEMLGLRRQTMKVVEGSR
jgi:GT2 family glycosyltransferase